MVIIGSDTGSSDDFIKITSPEIAIISCGKNNQYRHPNPIVLTRLTNIGATMYRTDIDGTIYLENVDGKNRIQKLETNTKGAD